MEDGIKCCLGIIVIFAIVAVFLFWPHLQEDLKTDKTATAMMLMKTNRTFNNNLPLL